MEVTRPPSKTSNKLAKAYAKIVWGKQEVPVERLAEGAVGAPGGARLGLGGGTGGGGVLYSLEYYNYYFVFLPFSVFDAGIIARHSDSDRGVNI